MSASMLSSWWEEEPLKEDIYWFLRGKEGTLMDYYAQSPQLAMRRYLVDFLAVICDTYELCVTARHLTVALLDFFMDRYDIEEKQLHLVALGCLLIATKFEEQEIKIPRSNDLNKFLREGYTKTEYLQVELKILDHYHWEIALPTPAHFTEFFISVALTTSDRHGDQAMTVQDFEKARHYLAKYTNYFLEISMQEHHYRDLKPSLIAAACVASARICLNISPTWSLELQEVTQYSVLELNSAIQAMLNTHQSDMKSGRRNIAVMTPPHSQPPSAQPTPTTPDSPDVIIISPPSSPPQEGAAQQKDSRLVICDEINDIAIEALNEEVEESPSKTWMVCPEALHFAGTSC